MLRPSSLTVSGTLFLPLRYLPTYSFSKDPSSFDSFLDRRVPRGSVFQAEQYLDILDRVGDIVCLHMGAYLFLLAPVMSQLLKLVIARSNLCFHIFEQRDIHHVRYARPAYGESYLSCPYVSFSNPSSCCRPSIPL